MRYESSADAVVIRDTHHRSQIILTQRRRYTYAAIGQAIIVASFCWLLSTSSITGIAEVLNEFKDINEWFGLGVTGSILLGAVSPAITLLALLLIRIHPSPTAHKVGKGFCKTNEPARTQAVNEVDYLGSG